MDINNLVSKFTQKNIILVLVFCLIFFIHLYSVNDNVFGTTDTFSYLTTAESLTEFKYTKVYLEDEPYQDWILPILPIMIAPFFVLDKLLGGFEFGSLLYFIRVYMVIVSLLASVVIYFMIRKLNEFNKYESLLITLVVSFSIMFNIYSRSILSELPYVLLVLLVFVLLLRRNSEDIWSLVLLFFLLLASIMTKASAVIFFPAILIYAVLNKKYKLFIPMFSSFFLAFVFFFLTKNDYFFGDVLGWVFSYRIVEGASFIEYKLPLIMNNIYTYLIDVLPSNVFPALKYVGFSDNVIIKVIFSLPILLISFYGYISRLNLRKRFLGKDWREYYKLRSFEGINFIDIFYPLHMLFFLFCSIVGGNGRYMMPILPLFIYYFFVGLRNVVSKFSLFFSMYIGLSRKLFHLVLILFFISSTIFAIGMAHSHHNKEQPLLWEDLEEVANYMEQNIEDADLVFSNAGGAQAPTIYLISGVQFSALNSSAESGLDFDLDILSSRVLFLSQTDDYDEAGSGLINLHESVYVTQNGYFSLYLVDNVDNELVFLSND
jgi:hypothetical protein